MTKDGFMFLVMGFTGKKSAAIKEAYISIFNEMAAQLSSPAPAQPDAKKCHYPKSLLAQPHYNPPGKRDEGLHLAKLTDRKFASPLNMLLTELATDGHEVEACHKEYYAMHDRLSAAAELLDRISVDAFRLTHGDT